MNLRQAAFETFKPTPEIVPKMSPNGVNGTSAKDNLSYGAQTPSPETFISCGSIEKDASGTIIAIPEYIPRPPVLASLLEERAERKRKVAAGFRVFAKMGWGFGNNGHISAKDPIRTDCFWMNPCELGAYLIVLGI